MLGCVWDVFECVWDVFGSDNEVILKFYVILFGGVGKQCSEPAFNIPDMSKYCRQCCGSLSLSLSLHVSLAA